MPRVGVVLDVTIRSLYLHEWRLSMDNLTEKQAEYLPYFVMLDLMQESGQMNMFGAPAKLREIHPGLGRRQAVDVVSEWMKTKTVASDE